MHTDLHIPSLQAFKLLKLTQSVGRPKLVQHDVQADELQWDSMSCDESDLLDDSAPPALAPVVPSGCGEETVGAGAGAPELLV